MATIISNPNNNNSELNTAGPVQQPQQPISRGGIKLQELFYTCISHWYWFVISLLICLLAAYYHLEKTTPLYVSDASIMLKLDDQDRAISSDESLLTGLGISTGNNHIWDELVLMKSPDMMRDIVRRLNLNTVYSVPERFRDQELYGSTLPVTVMMPEVDESSNVSFKLTLQPDSMYTISDIVKDGVPQNRSVRGHIGQLIKSPIGTLSVNANPGYSGPENLAINVRRAPVRSMANGLLGGLAINIDKESDNIINIRFTCGTPEKAKDVVNTLIVAYNDRWMRDKREFANNSSHFIDERLNLLQQELGSVDNSISSFKSSHLMPDVDAAASFYMNQMQQSSQSLRELRNQEYMAKYIRTYLGSSENHNKLLPTNSGSMSTNITSLITQYNTKILERNSLVDKSSATNPLVNDIDETLAALRQVLLTTIDNELVGIQSQIRSMEGVSGQATSQVASNPQQARYLLSVERQQKVKESLYLYLLQKREENEINQAISSYNTRIIREADGSGVPISPNRAGTYLIAIAVGLFAPAIILFLKELAISVVRGRKDLKGIVAPFAGELPESNQGPKKKAFSFKKSKPKPLVAVQENSRNSINEAFRVVRSNVEFMYGNSTDCRVIMLTSANPGSGKTFVTYNLGKSFSLKGKRVLCIDLDLRKASLSQYIKDKGYGVSDYLAGRVSDINQIIHKTDDAPNLSVITVGTMPPNPTELLYSERLKQLVDELRKHYDYVFIDCPPVEIVADSSIIGNLADNTIFVVRAGLYRLDMLPVIDEFYKSGKYPRMSVILNGTKDPTSRYARRYGTYAYGYGYGYGYEYGSSKSSKSK